MGFANTEARAAYFRRRYAERRAEALRILGGRCAQCGVTEELEVDHRNPADKAMRFSAMAMASRARFLAEVGKCQLLCGDCHVGKSNTDGSRSALRGEKHGRARLSDAQAHEVRELVAAGQGVREVARMFGVHHATVSRIANGKRRATP